MSDIELFNEIKDPIVLSDRVIETWYENKIIANLIGAKIVNLFGSGKDADFLERHYERIFCNLNFTHVGLSENKLSIGILCFPHYENFRPQEIIDAKKFSGSEEALNHMSYLLSRNENRVVVYANITPKAHESLKPHNPRYLPLKFFDGEGDDTEEKFDIVICWRMYDFERAKKRGKKVYLWVQDLPPDNIDTTCLDGVMYLSEFQRIAFEEKMNKPSPYVVAGNGLLLNYYTDEIRNSMTRTSHSCFYGSNYGKGLKVLLEIWGEVIEKFPDATLHICFGRTNWCTISDGELKYIISLIEKYPSVTEHGRLSNSEVAKKMMECSIFSYPITHRSATFEITAVQAQAAGCIPAIINNFCLPEVTHQDAFSCESKENYIRTLLSALENEDKIDRQKFIDWGKQFTWERVMEKWFELIK